MRGGLRRRAHQWSGYPLLVAHEHAVPVCELCFTSIAKLGSYLQGTPTSAPLRVVWGSPYSRCEAKFTPACLRLIAKLRVEILCSWRVPEVPQAPIIS